MPVFFSYRLRSLIHFSIAPGSSPMSRQRSRVNRDVMRSNMNCSPAGSYRRQRALHASNPWPWWFSAITKASSTSSITRRSYRRLFASTAGAQFMELTTAKSIASVSLSTNSKACLKPSFRALQNALTFFAQHLNDSLVLPEKMFGCIVFTSTKKTSSLRAPNVAIRTASSVRCWASLKAWSVSTRNFSNASANRIPCDSDNANLCCVAANSACNASAVIMARV